MTQNARAIFIDTNILVYANAEQSPWHDPARLALEYYYKQGFSLWISNQILREYLAIVTRPQSNSQPLSTPIALERVKYFCQIFNVAEDLTSVHQKLVELLSLYSVAGKQIHDANIAATMLVYQIPQLLTANVADFRRFSSVIEITNLSSFLAIE